MSVKLLSVKDWKATCPRCEKVVQTSDDETKCTNCNSKAWFKYPFGKGSSFESNDAYYSWYGLYCSKDCGWSINELKCDECGTTIRGRFISARNPFKQLMWNTFSFFFAFIIIGVIFFGGFFFLFWLGAQ